MMRADWATARDKISFFFIAGDVYYARDQKPCLIELFRFSPCPRFSDFTYIELPEQSFFRSLHALSLLT